MERKEIRKRKAAVALLLAGTVAFSAAFIERVDGGIIIATRTWQLDPLGEAKLRYTRLTRVCDEVQTVPAQVARSAMEKSDVDGTFRIGLGDPRFASSQGGWLLIETELTNLEPVIFLLRPEGGTYREAAGYSGTAAPFNDTQVIHEYLKEQAAGAPAQLIECYEPVGPPFARIWR